MAKKTRFRWKAGRDYKIPEFSENKQRDFEAWLERNEAFSALDRSGLPIMERSRLKRVFRELMELVAVVDAAHLAPETEAAE